MDINIETITEPADECVTLDELYNHLYLNVALEDVQDVLARYLTAARQQFEIETQGRIVLPTVFRQHLQDWPGGWRDGWREVFVGNGNGHFHRRPLVLFRANVLSVSSITYYDTNDTQQTLSGWTLDKSGIPGTITKDDGVWPALSCVKPRPVVVEFTAGWATADAVPQLVKLGIMMAAGHYYQAREAFGEVNYAEVPLGFSNICAKYRTGIGGV